MVSCWGFAKSGLRGLRYLMKRAEHNRAEKLRREIVGPAERTAGAGDGGTFGD